MTDNASRLVEAIERDDAPVALELAAAGIPAAYTLPSEVTATRLVDYAMYAIEARAEKAALALIDALAPSALADYADVALSQACWSAPLTAALLERGIADRRCWTGYVDDCARYGCAAAADMLLAAGRDHYRVQPNGHSALHVAAEFWNADVLEVLLRHGFHPVALGDNDFTPIHLAAMGNEDSPRDLADFGRTLDLLLAAGLDIDARDSSGHTPLLYALDDDTGRLHEFLKRGADCAAPMKNGHTAVAGAAADWMPGALRAMAEHGFDLRRRDAHGNSLLHTACASYAGSADGDPGSELFAQTVDALLDAGVDINVRGWEGWTPLMAALRTGEVERLRILLDRGADPDIRNERGEDVHACIPRLAGDADPGNPFAAGMVDRTAAAGYLHAWHAQRRLREFLPGAPEPRP